MYRRDLMKKKLVGFCDRTHVITLYFFFYLILLSFTHTHANMFIVVKRFFPEIRQHTRRSFMHAYYRIWWRGLSKSLLFSYTPRPVCPADVHARLRPRVVVVIGSSTPSHYINYSAINGSRGSASVETGRKRYVHTWFASSRSSRRHSSFPRPLFRVGEERERARVGSTFSGDDTIQTPFLIWFFFSSPSFFRFFNHCRIKVRVCVRAMFDWKEVNIAIIRGAPRSSLSPPSPSPSL